MQRRRYDHRIKRIFYESQDPSLFPELNIPRTTIMTWIKNPPKEVISLKHFDKNNEELQVDIEESKVKILKLEALLILMKQVRILFETYYGKLKLNTMEFKTKFINSIKETCQSVSLKESLEIIGIHPARYHYIAKSLKECDATNLKICPKLRPTRLTLDEVMEIKKLVTSEDFSHYSISSLYLHAKRNNVIFASLATWYRTIKEHNLLRPLKRIHPLKPKVGVRALAPNDIWHMDLSVFRFIDGSKAYIQAIIDNFSRMILAYRVSKNYGGENSKNLLYEAIETARIKDSQIIKPPDLFIDSGTENLNTHVQEIEDKDLIKKVIAQIDIHFSNSMIEAFFRKLKHHYLFNKLNSTFQQLESNVKFFVNEHNNKIPLMALKGATPFEKFNNKWNQEKIDIINQGSRDALAKRTNVNRNLICKFCSKK